MSTFIDIPLMDTLAKEFDIQLTTTMLNQLDTYAAMLVEWNSRINLTSILEPREIVIKHFLDSLILTKHLNPTDRMLIDVGTGAGFPSLPCKIVKPNLDVTLLDSLQKRLKFLELLCSEMQISAKTVHGRAEDCGKIVEHREQYDIATARAVAHLRDLTEYCLPFVAIGGCFIALKGQDIDNELSESKNAINILGGEIESVHKFTLPDDNRRSIIVVRKTSKTPDSFPRSKAKMLKSIL